MDNLEKREIWPGWETVRLIGRGSFGAVYEIQRDVFGNVEKAALKVISIPQAEGDVEELRSDGFDDESITDTFKAQLRAIVDEYSMMRKLNACVNVVNCDDVMYVPHDDGIGWTILIRMELLTPLNKALPEQILPELAVKIGTDISKALVLCKRYNIVHRDIKPQNIFVSELGDYKLGDFGVAKTVEKTRGGTKIGTYKYMAPEVYNNQPYGQGADVYSLGLVMYWLLNERRMPFVPLPPVKLRAGMEEEGRERRLKGEAIPAPLYGSEELKRIVLKAVAYDPKDRYQTAEELLRDLERLPKAGADREEPRPAPVKRAAEETAPAPAPVAQAPETAEEATMGVSYRPQTYAREPAKEEGTARFEEMRPAPAPVAQAPETAEEATMGVSYRPQTCAREPAPEPLPERFDGETSALPPSMHTPFRPRTEGDTLRPAVPAPEPVREELPQDFDEESTVRLPRQGDAAPEAEDATVGVHTRRPVKTAAVPKEAVPEDADATVGVNRRPVKPAPAPQPAPKPAPAPKSAPAPTPVPPAPGKPSAPEKKKGKGKLFAILGAAAVAVVALVLVLVLLPKGGAKSTAAPAPAPAEATAKPTVNKPGPKTTPKPTSTPTPENEKGVFWSMENDTLTITGSGQMVDFESMEETPWAQTRSKIKHVVVAEGITYIGSYAFNNCPKLESVELPASLRGVGKEAFSYCPAMTSVTVASDNRWFASEDGVLFSKDMTELAVFPGGKGSGATYAVPSGVVVIHEAAFAGASKLRALELPDGLKKIETHAFTACANLRSVRIPASVTEIGYGAFYDCNMLNSVLYGGSTTQWRGIHFWDFNDVLFSANIQFNSP